MTDLDDMVQWEAVPLMLDAVVTAALRLYEYEHYGGSESKAIAGLRRRFPEWSEAVLLNLLRYFGELFTLAKQEVLRQQRLLQHGHPIPEDDPCGGIDQDACF